MLCFFVGYINKVLVNPIIIIKKNPRSQIPDPRSNDVDQLGFTAQALHDTTEALSLKTKVIIFVS